MSVKFNLYWQGYYIIVYNSCSLLSRGLKEKSNAKWHREVVSTSQAYYKAYNIALFQHSKTILRLNKTFHKWSQLLTWSTKVAKSHKINKSHFPEQITFSKPSPELTIIKFTIQCPIKKTLKNTHGEQNVPSLSGVTNRSLKQFVIQPKDFCQIRLIKLK